MICLIYNFIISILPVDLFRFLFFLQILFLFYNSVTVLIVFDSKLSSTIGEATYKSDINYKYRLLNIIQTYSSPP